MISEYPNIPRQFAPEDRFIVSLKTELRRHAEEINKLIKNLSGYYNKDQIDSVVDELRQSIHTVPENVVTRDELEDALSNISVGLPEWANKIKIDANGRLCQVVRE